jgi:hypothetical protein
VLQRVVLVDAVVRHAVLREVVRPDPLVPVAPSRPCSCAPPRARRADAGAPRRRAESRGGASLSALFFPWLRSSWQTTTWPDGMCVIRTADSSCFTCWPAGAARAHRVDRRSSGARATSTSSASGSTATVAADVWIPALRLGLRHALHAVAAGFVLQRCARRHVALDREHDLLETRRVVVVDHSRSSTFPAPAPRVTAVQVVEIAREQRRLVDRRPGADLDDHLCAASPRAPAISCFLDLAVEADSSRLDRGEILRARAPRDRVRSASARIVSASSRAGGRVREPRGELGRAWRPPRSWRSHRKRRRRSRPRASR